MPAFILHMLQLVLQRFPTTPGNSMRHGCDMERAGFCRLRSADFQGAFPTIGGYHADFGKGGSPTSSNCRKTLTPPSLTTSSHWRQATHRQLRKITKLFFAHLKKLPFAHLKNLSFARWMMNRDWAGVRCGAGRS